MAEVIDNGTPEDPELQSMLQKGSKPWNRSKIMIVGEGRAGKTALANSIIGKKFSETESTIGIGQFTCDVKMANLGANGAWDDYANPEKELEIALAKMILAQRQAEKQSADKSQNSKIADKKEIMEEDKKPVGLIGRFKQLLGSSQPSEPQ